MISEGKVGVYGSVSIVFITILSGAFFTSPAVLAEAVGPASWYLTAFSAISAFVGFTIIYFLMKRFPGKNIIEVFNLSLGNVLGFVFSFILFFWALINTATFMREFSEVLKVYTLPQSPVNYILIIYLVVLIIISMLGFETITRVCKTFLILIISGLLLVYLVSAQNYNFNNLFPILGNGFWKTFSIGIQRSGFYGNTIILAIVAGALQNIKTFKKSGYLGLAISSLFGVLTLLVINLSFPYQVVSEMTSPLYELTSNVDYGRFFSRIDSLFVVVWVIGSLISSSVFFYTSISIYCKMFRIQKVRPMVLPFAILVFVLANVPSDITTVSTGWVHTSRQFSFIPCYIIPLIALIVAKFRKKGATGNQ